MPGGFILLRVLVQNRPLTGKFQWGEPDSLPQLFFGAMLLSTTSEIPAHTITGYHGMVISQVTAGRHLGKDIAAGVRDIFGGRSKSLETDLEGARKQALDELASEARQMGANAVVGIRVDMENVGGSMLLFVGQGTAVTAVKGILE